MINIILFCLLPLFIKTQVSFIAMLIKENDIISESTRLSGGPQTRHA